MRASLKSLLISIKFTEEKKEAFRSGASMEYVENRYLSTVLFIIMKRRTMLRNWRAERSSYMPRESQDDDSVLVSTYT